MTVKKEIDGKKLYVYVDGRLDTTTAPKLESEVKDEVNAASEITFDFKNLEYISSAGLRVLLAFQKLVGKDEKMVIKNANDTIMEVFSVTGFSDILTIE